MIIPSIDLQGGHAVQLVGGKQLEIDAGDPRPIAEQFGRVGEVAVIDLDAAMGTGSNRDVIQELIGSISCRVGGGIRNVQTAIDWLDAGASKVILGTAAEPEILKELPRERVIAALDADQGEIVVEGWKKRTGRTITDRIQKLREYVGGFLITFVEHEGRLGGLPTERIKEIVELAGDARVTVAGGVATPDDIAQADRLGADAQVGMALYSGRFDLADGYTAPLRTDREDGLWPTIVSDEHGVALGLVYSSLESVRESLNTGRGTYFSRSRNGLWVKGLTSGDTQEVLRIDADCDRDALRFTVRQSGSGFCHLKQTTCFGQDAGVTQLNRTIQDRFQSPEPGSYTARLRDDPELLKSKLLEEVHELIEAESPAEAAWEAADVLYFTLAAAQARGASLAEIERELNSRSKKITRRPGNAKPQGASS